MLELKLVQPFQPSVECVLVTGACVVVVTCECWILVGWPGRRFAVAPPLTHHSVCGCVISVNQPPAFIQSHHTLHNNTNTTTTTRFHAGPFPGPVCAQPACCCQQEQPQPRRAHGQGLSAEAQLEGVWVGVRWRACVSLLCDMLSACQTQHVKHCLPPPLPTTPLLPPPLCITTADGSE